MLDRGTLMNWQPIHKVRAAGAIRANLDNYEHACASFSWDTVRDELSVPAKFNIAGAIDRHADGLRRDHLAIRWLGDARFLVWRNKSPDESFCQCVAHTWRRQ